MFITSRRKNEKRRIVHINDIPQIVQDAFISIEDETFYENNGVNWKRTIGATVSWIINRCSYNVIGGVNYHWEYTFFIGAACLITASIIASRVKERVNG